MVNYIQSTVKISGIPKLLNEAILANESSRIFLGISDNFSDTLENEFHTIMDFERTNLPNVGDIIYLSELDINTMPYFKVTFVAKEYQYSDFVLVLNTATIKLEFYEEI